MTAGSGATVAAGCLWLVVASVLLFVAGAVGWFGIDGLVVLWPWILGAGGVGGLLLVMPHRLVRLGAIVLVVPFWAFGAWMVLSSDPGFDSVALLAAGLPTIAAVVLIVSRRRAAVGG